MARERMVTRTIEFTVAEYTALNVLTNEVHTSRIVLSGNLDASQALKETKKEIETVELKVVIVTSVRTFEKLYGMPEQVFMNIATELDPVTRKPIFEIE